MALIKCPECKKKISDQCDACPQCGYPIKSALELTDIASVDAVHLQKEETENEKSIVVPSKSKKKKIVVIVACLFFALAAFIAFAFSMRTNSVDKIRQSVVKINVYDEDGNLIQTGSGFVAFDKNTLVTNAHVITGGYSVDAVTESDERIFVDGAVYYSQDEDIAILKINGKSSIDVLGYSMEYKVGDKIIAIGSPLGIKNSVSEGVVSNSFKDGTIQHTAPISSGSSGGALFNSKGQVIGMNTATLTAGQNLNLAIPMAKIKDAYEQSKNSKVQKIQQIQSATYKEIESVILNNEAGKNIIDIVKDKSKAISFYACEYKNSGFVDTYYMNQIVSEGLASNWIDINANGGWGDDNKTYYESVIPQVRIIKVNNISDKEIQNILLLLQEEISDNYAFIAYSPYDAIFHASSKEYTYHYYSQEYLNAYKKPILNYSNGYIYKIVCSDSKLAKQIEEEINKLP